jgi:hypothetical protein
MLERLLAKGVEDFAIKLAQDFAARHSPQEGASDVNAAVLARAVDDVCNRAADFQRARRLGIYGKAKFGTAFKLHLAELGYPDEFVDEFTRRLLISMSGK